MFRAPIVTDVVCGADDGFWLQAFGDRCADLARLTDAIEMEALNQFGSTSWLAALSAAANGFNCLLGGMRRDEVQDLARLAEVSAGRIIVANLLYDFFAGACSTFITPTKHGPLHARNLDWEFPEQLLRRATTVLRVHNAPHGDYCSATWPGLFGMLTGMAPGRFSVSVNYVRHALSSVAHKFLRRALTGYVPVTWAVRHAFDELDSYDEAVEYLSNVSLLAPVLLAVSGTESHEACIIERTPRKAYRRTFKDGCPLYLTNHYAQPQLIPENCDVEPEISDTIERFEALTKIFARLKVQTAAQALRVLSRRALFSSLTQHQVVMRAATGLFTVHVPGGHTVEAGF
jgi:hypothetical protein